jgi:PAS domain S-box-containing protein
MDFLISLLGRNGFLPHGYCFTWSPGLLWTMVGSDAVIAAAYFSIPLAIFKFVRQRSDPSTRSVAWLFCAFIFACGVTHLMDIWTIWQPDYGLQALTKLATAGISMVTAFALWPLIPQALKIPSVGQLQAVIASLQAEVARRLSAEDQLAETQQSLAVTLGSIGAGFIALDRGGRITRMNAVAESVTGWRQDEARGWILWKVLQREGRPAEYEARNPVDVLIELDPALDTAHHVTAIARDGTRTPLELKVAPTYANDGSVRGAALVFRDLSVAVRAAAEASLLSAIVESSEDAIIGKTLEGRITSWNRAAEAMFGYSADEAIGQPVQMLLPPEREAEEMRILADLASGHRVPAFDTVRRAKDGHLLDVSVTISPIRDARGRVIGASKIARDVSQARRAAALAEEARLTAQRLEAENRQIQDASRLKSLFLANMSHELRTPLNAIIGFAELMHSGAVRTDSPKHHEYLGHIASSGHHLLQLINDVLDLSKVESGKFEFFPEAVQLPVLVREVTDILHTGIQRKRLEMGIDIDPELGELQLDPARLKQVLYNYLSNAIKFTPEGGRVTVRARAHGPLHFRLEVEDNGIGIAEADLARLFVEFQQLDAGANKQHQGTGLGLALTRRLVQAQGGHVGVRSEPGRGSVFYLVLGRVHGAAPDLSDPNALPDAQAFDPRLLVIEDDPQGQALLVQALRDTGFRVDLAASGAQALQQALRQAYAAITLDLLLPDQPGLGVLAGIRSEGASQGSPVVGMSMATKPGGAARFAITDVLCKPIRTAEIVSAMARLHWPTTRRARVMVIDDDPVALDLMQATLAGIDVETVCLLDGRQALAEMDRHRPDAIILDLMMPEFDGFAVLDALHGMPAWRDTPVFIWTSMLLTEAEYASLARSARAIVGKGGGALASMLDALRRWRPPVAALPEEGER